jgi:hypothetical protein
MGELNLLLRSLLIVLNNEKGEKFNGSLMNFVVGVTGLCDDLSVDDRRSLYKLLLAVTKHEHQVSLSLSQASFLLKNNSFMKFMVHGFYKDEETLLSKLKVILNIYGFESTTPLFPTQGFDLAVIGVVLRGFTQNEEINDLASFILHKVSFNAKLSPITSYLDLLVGTKEKKLQGAFDSEIFTPSLILVQKAITQIKSSVDNLLLEHEKCLSSTDKEVQPDYAKLDLSAFDNPAFIKFGTPLLMKATTTSTCCCGNPSS